MYRIEIEFDGRWAIVADGIKTRDDAHWAVSRWRQHHLCYSHEAFRVVEVERVAILPRDCAGVAE